MLLQRKRSVFKMFDGLRADSYSPQSALDDLPHLVLPVQNSSGLFILVNVDFKFIQQFFVDTFVLVNQCQDFIHLRVHIFVGVNPNKVLLPQLLLLCHYSIQFSFLGSDVSLDVSEPVAKVLPFRNLIRQVGSVCTCICSVFLSLLHQALVSQLELFNVISQTIQFILCPFGLFISLFQFSHQLDIIIFGLMQCFIKSGICGLTVSDLLLKILEFTDVCIQKCVQRLTFILELLPLLLQYFYGISNVFILLMNSIVLIFESFDFVAKSLDFFSSGVGHPFHAGVFPEQVFNLKVRLLKMHSNSLNFLFEIDDPIFVDI